MNDNLMFGINEEELTSLSLELLDYADEISTILSKINLKIDWYQKNKRSSSRNIWKTNAKRWYNIGKFKNFEIFISIINLYLE